MNSFPLYLLHGNKLNGDFLEDFVSGVVDFGKDVYKLYESAGEIYDVYDSIMPDVLQPEKPVVQLLSPSVWKRNLDKLSNDPLKYLWNETISYVKNDLVGDWMPDFVGDFALELFEGDLLNQLDLSDFNKYLDYADTALDIVRAGNKILNPSTGEEVVNPVAQINSVILDTVSKVVLNQRTEALNEMAKESILDSGKIGNRPKISNILLGDLIRKTAIETQALLIPKLGPKWGKLIKETALIYARNAVLAGWDKSLTEANNFFNSNFEIWKAECLKNKGLFVENLKNIYYSDFNENTLNFNLIEMPVEALSAPENAREIALNYSIEFTKALGTLKESDKEYIDLLNYFVTTYTEKKLLQNFKTTLLETQAESLNLFIAVTLFNLRANQLNQWLSFVYNTSRSEYYDYMQTREKDIESNLKRVKMSKSRMDQQNYDEARRAWVIEYTEELNEGMQTRQIEKAKAEEKAKTLLKYAGIIGTGVTIIASLA